LWSRQADCLEHRSAIALRVFDLASDVAALESLAAVASLRVEAGANAARQGGVALGITI